MKKLSRFSNIHQIIDYVIEESIYSDSICVDGTLGNGYDSLKILRILSDHGKLYSFDIQEKAIINSRELFEKEGFFHENINLILDSHENVLRYVNEPIDFFILNLGYLPGSDKNITTKATTVKSFLDNISTILKSQGIGIIVFYPGHKEGKIELEYISSYLSTFDQKCYNIIEFKYINQINNPPQVIILERV